MARDSGAPSVYFASALQAKIEYAKGLLKQVRHLL